MRFSNVKCHSSLLETAGHGITTLGAYLLCVESVLLNGRVSSQRHGNHTSNPILAQHTKDALPHWYLTRIPWSGHMSEPVRAIITMTQEYALIEFWTLGTRGFPKRNLVHRRPMCHKKHNHIVARFMCCFVKSSSFLKSHLKKLLQSKNSAQLQARAIEAMPRTRLWSWYLMNAHEKGCPFLPFAYQSDIYVVHTQQPKKRCSGW